MRTLILIGMLALSSCGKAKLNTVEMTLENPSSVPVSCTFNFEFSTETYSGSSVVTKTQTVDTSKNGAYLNSSCNKTTAAEGKVTVKIAVDGVDQVSGSTEDAAIDASATAEYYIWK